MDVQLSLLIVLVSISIILNVILLIFVYLIFRKNESIHQIYYLVGDNNMRINDVYEFIIKKRKLKGKEIDSIEDN